MATPLPPQRRRAVYRGRVQGVGFRYSAQRIAQGLAVKGFVRNLPDGRVELVAEGEAAELDRLLAEISALMGDYIREVAVHMEPATGQFAAFEIVH